MRRLYLTRHGETAWNAVGKLQGHTDTELNDTGRAQASAVAQTLTDAGITTIWTSDLARARETGAIIATALSLPPPEIDPELRERRFGIFEGLTRDECIAQYPEAWNAWVAMTGSPPGGEPREDVVARMSRVLARIATGDGGPLLVVSHGAVMRLWLMELLAGTDPPLIPNGAVYVVDHDGRAFQARRH